MKLTPTERAAIEQKIEVFKGKIAALREMLGYPLDQWTPDGTMSPKDINDAVREAMARIIA